MVFYINFYYCSDACSEHVCETHKDFNASRIGSFFINSCTVSVLIKRGRKVVEICYVNINISRAGEWNWSIIFHGEDHVIVVDGFLVQCHFI